MKLKWLPLALGDLAYIKKYYTEEASIKVAAGQLRKISKSAALLKTQPYMGHPSPNDTDDDVLEWNIPSTTYTLPYMVVGDEIQILRVFDQKRKRPESWH